MKPTIAPATGFRFYVSDAGDADQQMLVETGKDGGAVLEDDCIQKLQACHGLALPEDVPPGILADFVGTMRLIGNQALSPDWAAEQAFDWMRAEAKAALEKIKPIRRTASAISRQCAEEERDELAAGLEEIRTLLSGHPEAAQGNSKVHFCMHRAAGLLAKLAPAGSPDAGVPVSPPEPEDYYQRCRRETAEYHAAKQDAKPVAGFTLFRSRADLDAYFAELNRMGEGGSSYEPPFDRPDFPFFGRQILDDNGWPEDFQTIGGEEAYVMAQALDSNVTRF